jgi:alcohol dehydrogenase
MKALVYHGPGQRGWDTVGDPAIIDPTDIIVRIDSSTICGSDLHILKGDVPETTPGTVLGHEAVGTVQEIGANVSTVAIGDRVLLSCVSSCGRCRFCKEGRYGQCLGGGGWIFGHLIDGLQAEYARVPFADNSVYKVPDELVASGRLDPTIFATHRFALADTMSAYDTFADAAATNALKVVLEGSEHDASSNGRIAAGLVAGPA